MGVTSNPIQPGEVDDGFTGFGTVQDEIESLKLLIDKNRRLANANENKLEQKVNGLVTDITRTEKSLSGIQVSLQDLITTVKSNSVRIGLLEEKTFNLSLSVKGVEKKIMKRITNFELWIESSNVEGQLYAESSTANRASEAYGPCKQSISTMRADIADLQGTMLLEKEALEDMRSSVRDLTGKLSESVTEFAASMALLGDRQTTQTYNLTPKSMTIVKLEIEWYIQQIIQLIKTEISQDAPDLKPIEKCNNVDVPKVLKAITSCGDALEKYVRLPNMDSEYVDHISTILVRASDWCLMVEALYSKMEIHSITNPKGDMSDVGVFSDNSSRTIYEFLQDVELAVMGWGSQVQRAN